MELLQTTLCYLEKDGAYLMLHRVKKKNDVNHDKWVGVGGKFEPGEDALTCALREVREETGLEIEVGEPFDAWTLRAPGRRILGVDFVCRWCSGDVRLSHEHESFAWLTLEEVEAKGWEAEPVYRKAFELVEA